MKREWTDLELAEHWTLLPAEAALLANKTGPTRLGFAVLLKFFQYAGRFPFSIQELPTAAVASIAVQVGVLAEEFSRYDWQGRAVKSHSLAGGAGRRRAPADRSASPGNRPTPGLARRTSGTLND
jgi:Domain of unknown function (DUF4158)